MTTRDTDGFASWGTDAPSVPVLLSVPHAGRDYPNDIYDALRLPPAALVRLEDRYADLLTRRCVQMGHPVIMAHRARAWIDLNRGTQDIDADMVQGAQRGIIQAQGSRRGAALALSRGGSQGKASFGSVSSRWMKCSTV